VAKDLMCSEDRAYGPWSRWQGRGAGRGNRNRLLPVIEVPGREGGSGRCCLRVVPYIRHHCIFRLGLGYPWHTSLGRKSEPTENLLVAARHADVIHLHSAIVFQPPQLIVLPESHKPSAPTKQADGCEVASSGIKRRNGCRRPPCLCTRLRLPACGNLGLAADATGLRVQPKISQEASTEI
jgi:hypothetical protein